MRSRVPKFRKEFSARERRRELDSTAFRVKPRYQELVDGWLRRLDERYKSR